MRTSWGGVDKLLFSREKHRGLDAAAQHWRNLSKEWSPLEFFWNGDFTIHAHAYSMSILYIYAQIDQHVAMLMNGVASTHKCLMYIHFKHTSAEYSTKATRATNVCHYTRTSVSSVQESLSSAFSDQLHISPLYLISASSNVQFVF